MPSPKDAETTKKCILATAWLQIENGDVYRQLGNFGDSFLFSSDPDMPNEAVHLLLEAALIAGRCGLFLLAQGWADALQHPEEEVGAKEGLDSLLFKNTLEFVISHDNALTYKKGEFDINR